MQSKLFKLTFWLSLIGLVVFIVDYGYEKSHVLQDLINVYYFIVLVMGSLSVVYRYIKQRKIGIPKVFAFDLIYFIILLIVGWIYITSSSIIIHEATLNENNWIKIAIFLTFMREFSELNINFKRARFNPAQLFILSFMLIILVGSLLLMLPNSTYEGIGFIDALFTSTSAVCVTGLIVVDTATYFTPFGQSIILFLIQIGGIGILTFASYFSYFFKGGATYENQLALNDITSSQKLSEVFGTLKNILIITLLIELGATALIYFSLDESLFSSKLDQVYFAGFHAISAFCNAGFSTLTDNLYQTGFKFNYQMQSVVMFTFVIGGLGFPIVVNIINYIKYRIQRLFYSFNRRDIHRPWVLTLNSRITLITTFTIMIVSFIVFYLTEYNNALVGHSSFGKIISTLFSVTTPRTAGFNTLDLHSLHFSSIMLIFLLMWIGASPTSTGGGIKTSTIAVATLNLFSLAKGKSRIEIFRRRISDISVRRSYAIISLSLIVIGFSVFLITIFDEDKHLIDIAFECFSAYSTVGLSLGITPDLSQMSKLVIIVVMLVGRVGMLSVLIAVFKKMKQVNYQYPTEEITIT